MRRVIKSKIQARARRAHRVRARCFGTGSKPRLSVSRSLKNMYLQLIDDEKGRTLIGLSSHNLRAGGGIGGPARGSLGEGGRKAKVALAYAAGLALAKKATELGVKEICFDRHGYLYHGRVAAVAEGAREGGLKF